MGWGGVGWGMLTFVWTCWGSWCYADDGVGWGGVGHVNVRVNLLRFLMLRWWWGGVGWGMLTFVWTCWACLNLFEAEIAFRLGEIHIYLENHQIQTSEFQSFCDRWIGGFRLGETMIFWKKLYFTTSLSGPPGCLCTAAPSNFQWQQKPRIHQVAGTECRGHHGTCAAARRVSRMAPKWDWQGGVTQQQSRVLRLPATRLRPFCPESLSGELVSCGRPPCGAGA